MTTKPTQRRRMLALSRQKGASLMVVLGILALISLATWLLSSRGEGNASSLTDAAANSTATAMINQANAMYSGFQQAAVNGVAPSDVTLDDNGQTGLFAPQIGGVMAQQPAARSFTDQIAHTWELVPVIFPGAASSKPDQVVVVRGVRREVCQAVVRQFQGNQLAYIEVLDGDFVPDADLMFQVAALNQKQTSCVQIGSDYVMYSLMAAN